MGEARGLVEGRARRGEGSGAGLSGTEWRGGREAREKGQRGGCCVLWRMKLDVALPW